MVKVPGYILKRAIGRGGMSTVYLAVQRSLERQVALKVMAPAFASDPAFSKRFRREARTIARLNHTNIVPIYDVGSTEDFHDYFSMQYLPGGDFADRIQVGVTEGEVIRVLTGIARALKFAHQHDFIHRDVTPGNILFDKSGTPLLTDFGIARAVRVSTRITGAGMSVGTSQYMSPEQARGGKVDGRSDLYSLAVVAYEALSGFAPFDGIDDFAIAYAHVFEDVPPLSEKLSHWQPFMDVALAKSPGSRFQTADSFSDSLTQLAKAQLGEGFVFTAPEIPKVPAWKQVLITLQDSASHFSGKGLDWFASLSVWYAEQRQSRWLNGVLERSQLRARKQVYGSVMNHSLAVLKEPVTKRSIKLFFWRCRLFVSLFFGDSKDWLSKHCKQCVKNAKLWWLGAPSAKRYVVSASLLMVLLSPSLAFIQSKSQVEGSDLVANAVQSTVLPNVQQDSKTVWRSSNPAINVALPEADEAEVMGSVSDSLPLASAALTTPTKEIGDELAVKERELPSQNEVDTSWGPMLELPRKEPPAMITVSDRRMYQNDLPDIQVVARNTEADKHISMLLGLANEDLLAHRLSVPKGQSAIDRFDEVLKLDPNNISARAGIESVIATYLTLIDKANHANQPDKVAQYQLRGISLSKRYEFVRRSRRAFEEGMSTTFDALIGSGERLLQTWKQEAAIRHFSLALALQPNNRVAKEALNRAKRMGKEGYRFRDYLQSGGAGSEMIVLNASRSNSVKQKVAIALFEVTVNQYQQFLQRSGYANTRAISRCRNEAEASSLLQSGNWENAGFPQPPDHPVVCVDYNSAMAFTQWLTQETGFQYRLLNELEWDAINSTNKDVAQHCRMGNIGDLWLRAQYQDKPVFDCEDGWLFTAPVGTFEPNSNGVYDLVGNVREWLSDCADTQDSGSGSCKKHVVKGISWLNGPSVKDPNNRSEMSSGMALNTLGFRVLRELPKKHAS